jgi:hypothetical protein
MKSVHSGKWVLMFQRNIVTLASGRIILYAENRDNWFLLRVDNHLTDYTVS